MTDYIVVAIRAHGDVRQMERTFRKSPTDAQIAMWLSQQNPPWVQSHGWHPPVLAVRYYPRWGGWKITNFSHARMELLRNGHTQVWKNFTKEPKIYPSEAAAVMKAIYLLNPPVQQQLAL
jgi:hypothetical protein